MTAARCLRSRRVVLLMAGLANLTGCSAYLTPGGSADFTLFADDDIAAIMERRPAAQFPVHLATARIQAPKYRSYTVRGYGSGNFSVVTVRDVETQNDYDRLGQLPQVAAVAPLTRLLISARLTSGRQLRHAAAALHADMLLLYTFDTNFLVGDALKPLTVITLGLSPNKDVRVATTVSAILLDVRTGYVYGTCEATARRTQLASAWTSQDAVDRTRRKTEREAFEQMLDDFENLWTKVINQHKADEATKAKSETP
jgi:hypothetical protein